MALKRCIVCLEYFPEPTIKLKNRDAYRHEDCLIWQPRTDLERQMEYEMLRFKESHPLFYANLEIDKKKAEGTNIPITKG